MDKHYRNIYARLRILGIKRPRKIEEKRNKAFKASCLNQNLANIITDRYGSIKTKCAKGQIPFDLTREYLLDLYNKQNGLCHYTKLEMSLISKGANNFKNPYILSVDRLCAKKGYVKENIVLCLNIINTMKNTSSLEQFIFFCELVVNHKGRLLELHFADSRE